MDFHDAIMLRLHDAERELEYHGIRRCDAEACNCGRYHVGHECERRELLAQNAALKAALELHGIRRCDVPDCNCGGYRDHSDEARLSDEQERVVNPLKEAIRQATESLQVLNRAARDGETGSR